MTHPHRWLRAAHKIAPNGALFTDTSCYWQGGKEGSRPLPTDYRMTRGYRQGAHFRQVCRGRIHASRAVYPIHRNIRVAATGGIYAAPTNDPLNCYHCKTAGGACPAPTRVSDYMSKSAPQGALLLYPFKINPTSHRGKFLPARAAGIRALSGNTKEIPAPWRCPARAPRF